MYELIDVQNRVVATSTLPPQYVSEQQSWLMDGVAWVGDPQRAYTVRGGPVQGRDITRTAFRQRFTQAEKVGIELAALDDPAAPMAQRALAAAVRSSQADVQASTFINLDDPATRSGVQQLEAAGLLAAGRAAQILDGPIAERERYLGAVQ